MADNTEQTLGRPSKRVSNRIFMKISGKRMRFYSIVKHTGRRSGREYQNPVIAYPLGDGFVISVLYGLESNWVRNVMATHRLTIRTKGHDFALENPKIIPASRALTAFSRWVQLVLKAQKTEDFVWAHQTT